VYVYVCVCVCVLAWPFPQGHVRRFITRRRSLVHA
jgi:hypothetical protein